MGYGLQHPFYIGLDMWIFSVGGHSGGRKDHKKPIRLPLSLNKFSSETRLHCWICLIDTV